MTKRVLLPLADGFEPLEAADFTDVLAADDPAIDEQIRGLAFGGLDVVYDLVGAATFPIAAAAVRDGGSTVTLCAASGQPSVPQSLATRNITIRDGGMPQFVRDNTVKPATEASWDALRRRLFSDLPIARYPFDDIVRAHHDMKARRLTELSVLTTQEGTER